MSGAREARDEHNVKPEEKDTETPALAATARNSAEAREEVFLEMRHLWMLNLDEEEAAEGAQRPSFD